VKAENQTLVEFETAKVGMDKVGLEAEAKEASLLDVAFLSGFCPAEDAGRLKRAAAENGWALSVDDPGEDDKPPTLQRNNKLVNIIKPLFAFLGTVPGYREYDVSPSYFLFFCIFFAMIYGDAAYGLLILVISLAVGFSAKAKSATKKMPAAFVLFSILGCFTIVWGALNGAWFGVCPEVLKPLALIANSDFATMLNGIPGFFQKIMHIPEDALPQGSKISQWNVQFLCFSIGIIQLVYAHLKNIKRQLPSLTAVAQLGWLVMMVGLYFLVLSMLLKVAMPGFALYLIIGGIVVYFMFMAQEGGNFFKNMGKGFGSILPTFLNAVGAFADIISYIRLFAVGMAGTAIANSFNSMSGIENAFTGSVGEIILKLAGAAIILAFGHGLNMLMNALSVIVHGIRLNLLEYSGNHLGIEWSGYSYKPFALRQEAKL
jgi:V/A-type H+-transporting ATPase subunit I